ncbi:ABC transporter substrate-binding protein [Deinococcus metallilatus]|nr:ABC transporter substrate-binding protein [Deinococcus metallilatus]MBB5293421.1 peptide/nickel transport system substrate-binding protein [Deinococcus metallilatus]GMA15359.1 ABC transporter substrate-binding protein [Deinococcus metallilatus]
MKHGRLLTSALALTAFGAISAQAQTTLVIGIQSDPTGFDPEAILNNTSGFVMSTVYDSLVKYKRGTVEVEPGLAQSWKISPDGKTYTFTLRKGVTFQDGTPFNAQTFVKSLDRLFKKNDSAYIYNTGPVESYIDFTYGPMDSYQATGPYTVQFKLKKPFAPFLTSLAMVWNGVVSPAAAAKFGKDFRNNPVGTGPFVFKEWVRGDHVTLAANPNYWGGKPKVDRLIFKVIPDPQAAVLALKRGEVQILADVSNQTIPAIRADPNLRLLTQPGLTISGVSLPFNVKPFSDVRVRQALNYAIDKDALNRTLYQGLAKTLTSPLPEAQWGFDPSLKGYPYDPQKAKQLLTAAGYPNGFTAELLAYNTARGYNPAGPQLAIAIQGYLKQIGVNVNVKQMEFGSFLSTVRSGKYGGMALTGWSGDNGDPDNFLYELFASPNIPVGNTSGYKNPKVDALLQQAQFSTDRNQRVKLYQQAQRQIMQDAPWIFVNSTLQVRAARKEVQGLTLNPTQMFLDMQDVSLTK